MGQNTQGCSATAEQGHGSSEECQTGQNSKHDADNKLALGHESSQNDLKVGRCIGSHLVEHGQSQQEANQRSGIDNTFVVELIDQLAGCLESILQLAAESQCQYTGDDEATNNGEIQSNLQNNRNYGQDQGIYGSVLPNPGTANLCSPCMAALASVQEETSQGSSNNYGNDYSLILAPDVSYTRIW